MFEIFENLRVVGIPTEKLTENIRKEGATTDLINRSGNYVPRNLTIQYTG